MSFDSTAIGPLGPGINPLHTPPAARPRAVSDFAGALAGAVHVDTLPSSPPPEALRAVEAAARRYEWLRENGRELRFSLEPETRRIRIEVRDLEGRVIREIPAAEALDAISGGQLA